MKSQISETTFPNGFRLIYEESKSSLPITTIYVFCNLGAIHETEGVRGASHAIEHMCFKGTKKIPNTKAVFREYDKIGAYFNAFTVKRYTCFTIKCDSNYAQNSIEIVGDIMIHSKFSRADYARELPVVVEENNNNFNSAEYLIFHDMYRQLYRGTVYENPVDDLSYHEKGNLEYDDVVALYHRHYQPQNMIMSVVSDLPMHHILQFLKGSDFLRRQKIVDQAFSTIPLVPVIYKGLDANVGIQYNLREKKGITNTLLAIGFRTCPRTSEDKYVLDLMRVALSESSGRLFEILRVKNSVVYSSRVETEYHELGGAFVFFSKTDSHKLMRFQKHKGLLPLFVDIVRNFIKHGLTEEELTMAKGFMRGELLLELEGQLSQVQYNGEEVLYGHSSTGHTGSTGPTGSIIPYDELFERFYKPIRMSDVKRVISKYFVADNICVCLVSDKLPTLEIVKKECEKIVV